MNNPKLYTKVNDLQQCDVIQLLERFSDMIKWRNDGKDSVLDIGCGSGDITSNILGSILPKSFKCLKGIDKSPEMVQYANTHYKSSKVSFDQWDVSGEVDKKVAQQFDHIFSFHTLHWVPDQKCAFQNIYDLLKPGGDILVMFPTNSVLYSIYKSQLLNPKFTDVTKDVETFINPYHGKANAEVIIKKLVTNIGFVNVLIHMEDKQYTFNGAENLKKFMEAVYPPVAQLTGDLQNEMLQEFFTTFAANTSEFDDKQFILPYRVMSMYAQKNDKY